MKYSGSKPLTLFKPLKVWLALSLVSATLIALAGYRLTIISERENQRIAELQADTLVRSRIQDLESGNYRAFVEGVGRTFKDLKISIQTDNDHFVFGPNYPQTHCHTLEVPSLRTKQSIRVSVCREYQTPFWSIAALLLGFIVISAVTYVFLVKLERQSVFSLTGFLRKRGVEIDPQSKLTDIVSSIEEIKASLDGALSREVELRKSEAVANLAQQVAHDIRSPLVALNVAMKSLETQQPEKASLARSALSQLREIAKDLSLKTAHKENVFNLGEAVTQTILLKEVEFTEKKIQTKISYIHSQAHHLCVGESSGFMRLLSNILNNANEAMQGVGIIRLRTQIQKNAVELTIEDDGPGISDDVISKIGRRGITEGKTDGVGLGLYHAKKTIELWGGTFSAIRKEPKGTRITLSLPIASNSAKPEI